MFFWPSGDSDTVRIVALSVAAGLIVTTATIGAGVHTGPNPLSMIGGFATAAAYMMLVVLLGKVVERSLHPGTDWLSTIEESPIALAVLCAGTLLAFAIVAVFSTP